MKVTYIGSQPVVQLSGDGPGEFFTLKVYRDQLNVA